QERGLYEKFGTALDKYLNIEGRVLELSRANKKSEATQLAFSEGRQALQAVNAALEEDAELNNKGAAADAVENANTYSSARNTTIALLITAIALGAFVAF